MLFFIQGKNHALPSTGVSSFWDQISFCFKNYPIWVPDPPTPRGNGRPPPVQPQKTLLPSKFVTRHRVVATSNATTPPHNTTNNATHHPQCSTPAHNTTHPQGIAWLRRGSGQELWMPAGTGAFSKSQGGGAIALPHFHRHFELPSNLPPPLGWNHAGVT